MLNSYHTLQSNGIKKRINDYVIVNKHQVQLAMFSQILLIILNNALNRKYF